MNSLRPLFLGSTRREALATRLAGKPLAKATPGSGLWGSPKKALKEKLKKRCMIKK